METTLKTSSADKTAIDHITKHFFDIFNNTSQRQPDWTTLYDICIDETIIIKKTGLTQTIYDLASFIEPRKAILTNGTPDKFQGDRIG